MKKNQKASKKIEPLESIKEDPIINNIKEDQTTAGIWLSKATVEEMIEKGNHQTFQRAQEEINKQSQQNLVSSIGIFSIPASILFFLGIEIQFLKTIDNVYDVISFMLILFALILFFNISLIALVKSILERKNSNLICFFLVFATFALGSGIALLVWNKQEKRLVAIQPEKVHAFQTTQKEPEAKIQNHPKEYKVSPALTLQADQSSQ